MRKMMVMTAAVLLSAAGLAGAQNLPGQTIQQRKGNQQHRIAQGIQSGQLTPHEAGRLEHQQARLNHEERNMRRASGGRLTPGDRATLTGQQNHLSREIYKDKHNGAVQR
jgi:hypothetical protein